MAEFLQAADTGIYAIGIVGNRPYFCQGDRYHGQVFSLPLEDLSAGTISLILFFWACSTGLPVEFPTGSLHPLLLEELKRLRNELGVPLSFYKGSGKIKVELSVAE